jgi:hypothetical protein
MSPSRRGDDAPQDDPRIAALLAGLGQAGEALAALDDAQKEQVPDVYERLEAALDYASVVIARTEPLLLGAGPHQQLTDVLGEIAGNPAAATASPDPYVDRLLSGLSILPATKDRDLDASVRAAAGNFRRSTTRRLHSTEEKLADTESSVETLRTELAAEQQAASEAIEQRQSAADQRLTEIEATAQNAVQRVEQQAGEQARAYEQETEDRDETFKERLRDFEQKAQARAGASATELDRVCDEGKDMVGALGVASVANNFGKDADREGKGYWALFVLTFLLSVGAVVCAALAATHAENDVKRLITKLALSVVLGTVAAFTGREAHDRRRAEKISRRTELELRTFGPFVESLPEKEKVRERIVMARRTFGQAQPRPDETEPDVGLLSTDDELDQRRQIRDADAA